MTILTSHTYVAKSRVFFHFEQFHVYNEICYIYPQGAQWLSGRVLDSRPRGSEFEPHRRHCVVVLEQDTLILA